MAFSPVMMVVGYLYMFSPPADAYETCSAGSIVTNSKYEVIVAHSTGFAPCITMQALCVLCGYFCDTALSNVDGHILEVRRGENGSM